MIAIRVPILLIGMMRVVIVATIMGMGTAIVMMAKMVVDGEDRDGGGVDTEGDDSVGSRDQNDNNNEGYDDTYRRGYNDRGGGNGCDILDATLILDVKRDNDDGDNGDDACSGDEEDSAYGPTFTSARALRPIRISGGNLRP